MRAVYHPRPEGGFVIEHTDDVEDVIEFNKALRNTPQSRKSDFRHVASIPPIFLLKWSREEGVDYFQLPGPEFAARIKRKLNDPSYAFLRTG